MWPEEAKTEVSPAVSPGQSLESVWLPRAAWGGMLPHCIFTGMDLFQARACLEVQDPFNGVVNVSLSNFK